MSAVSTSSMSYALVPCSSENETENLYPREDYNDGDNVDSSARVIVPHVGSNKDDDKTERLKWLLEEWANLTPTEAYFREVEREEVKAATREALAQEQQLRRRKEELQSWWQRLRTRALGGQDLQEEQNDEHEEVNEDDDSGDDIHTPLRELKLDAYAVPWEAQMEARHVLSCAKLHHSQDNLSFSSKDDLALVGWGTFVDWRRGGDVMTTSDRSELMTQGNEGLSRVRWSRLGTNSLLVSWGGGRVKLYRRVLRQDNEGEGWDAVACLDPSEAVWQNVDTRISHMMGEEGEEESPWWRFSSSGDKNDSAEAFFRYKSQEVLLHVTGLVPLIVDDDEEEPQDIDSDWAAAPTSRKAILVLSRLGGYLEFIPIPSDVWDGPVLVRRSSQQEGEEEEELCDLMEDVSDRVVAISTADVHHDVLTLDAVRTTVDSTTEWDETLYPEGPPAEYLVAASGRWMPEREVLSMWAVSLVVEEDEKDSKADSFTIHVRRLSCHVMDNTGPDVCTFVSLETTRLWQQQEPDETRSVLTSPSHVWIPSPMVRLHFSPIVSSVLMLVALDYHGGLTLFDCSAVLGEATHAWAREDEGESDKEVHAPLILLQPRSLVRNVVPWVSQVVWVASEASLLLAVVTCKEKDVRLYRLAFSEDETSSTIHWEQVELMDASLRQQSDVPLLLSSPEGTLQVVLVSAEQSDDNHWQQISWTCASLQTLNPIALAQSLLMEGHYRDALNLLRTNVSDNTVLLSAAHIGLWETEADVKALCQGGASLEYVEQVAMELLSSSSSRKQHSNLTVQNIRSIVGRVLQEGPSSLHKGQVLRRAFRWLGTIELLHQHLGGTPSAQLWRHQSRFFAASSMPSWMEEVATALAQRGDVAGVTLLLTRHAPATSRRRQEVLNHLPLAMPVSEYRHLLPVAENGEEAAAPSVAGMRLLLDDEGELDDTTANLTEENEEDSDDDDWPSWYLQRATTIHGMTGICDVPLELCLLGLDQRSEGDEEVHRKLRSFCFWAYWLQQMLLDAKMSRKNWTIMEMQTMGMTKLAVYLVLEDEGGEEELMSRYQKYVVPMVKEGGQCTMGTVQEALCEACVEKVQEAAPEKMRSALAPSRRLATASHRSRSLDHCILTDDRILMRLVVEVADSLTASCIANLLEDLWTMYECLPGKTASHKSNDLQERVDRLFLKLTLVNICQRWNVVSHWPDVDALMKSKEPQLLAGRAVMAGLSQSLAQRLAIMSTNHEATLIDWLADMNDWNDLLTHSGGEHLLPWGRILEQELVPFLLRSGQNDILRKLLSWRREWFPTPSASLRNAAVRFVRNILLSSSTRDLPKALERGRDVYHAVGRCSPDLEENAGNLHDLSEAVAWLLSQEQEQRLRVEGSQVWKVVNKQKSRIDFVLSQASCLMMATAEEWKDEAFAQRANWMWSSGCAGPPREDEERPPALPGAAVLHFSKLLSVHDVTIVQAFLVGVAIQAQQWGAAAALCANLLRQEKMEPAIQQQLGRCAECLASKEAYADVRMKREVCQLFLCWKCGNYQGYQDHRNVILYWFSILDYQYHNPPTQQAPSPAPEAAADGQGEGGGEFLVFKAAGMVAKSLGGFPKAPRSGDGTNVVATFHGAYTETIAHSGLHSTAGGKNDFFASLYSPLLYYQHHAAMTIMNVDEGFKKEVAVMLMRRVLDNTLRQGPYHVLQEGYNSVLLLLALALWLELRRADSTEDMTGLLAEVRQRTTEVPLPAASSVVRPNEAIVAQLLERGYSIHAARKCAVMTRNQGFSQALTWAIAHFQDADFDAPSIVICRDNVDRMEIRKQLAILFGSLRDVIRRGKGQTVPPPLPTPTPPSKVVAPAEDDDEDDWGWKEENEGKPVSLKQQRQGAATTKPEPEPLKQQQQHAATMKQVPLTGPMTMEPKQGNNTDKGWDFDDDLSSTMGEIPSPPKKEERKDALGTPAAKSQIPIAIPNHRQEEPDGWGFDDAHLSIETPAKVVSKIPKPAPRSTAPSTIGKPTRVVKQRSIQTPTATTEEGKEIPSSGPRGLKLDAKGPVSSDLLASGSAQPPVPAPKLVSKIEVRPPQEQPSEGGKARIPSLGAQAVDQKLGGDDGEGKEGWDFDDNLSIDEKSQSTVGASELRKAEERKTASRGASLERVSTRTRALPIATSPAAVTRGVPQGPKEPKPVPGPADGVARKVTQQQLPAVAPAKSTTGQGKADGDGWDFNDELSVALDDEQSKSPEQKEDLGTSSGSDKAGATTNFKIPLPSTGNVAQRTLPVGKTHPPPTPAVPSTRVKGTEPQGKVSLPERKDKSTRIAATPIKTPSEVSEHRLSLSGGDGWDFDDELSVQSHGEKMSSPLPTVQTNAAAAAPAPTPTTRIAAAFTKQSGIAPKSTPASTAVAVAVAVATQTGVAPKSTAVPTRMARTTLPKQADLPANSTLVTPLSTAKTTGPATVPKQAGNAPKSTLAPVLPTRTATVPKQTSIPVPKPSPMVAPAPVLPTKTTTPATFSKPKSVPMVAPATTKTTAPAATKTKQTGIPPPKSVPVTTPAPLLPTKTTAPTMLKQSIVASESTQQATMLTTKITAPSSVSKQSAIPPPKYSPSKFTTKTTAIPKETGLLPPRSMAIAKQTPVEAESTSPSALPPKLTAGIVAPVSKDRAVPPKTTNLAPATSKGHLPVVDRRQSKTQQTASRSGGRMSTLSTPAKAPSHAPPSEAGGSGWDFDDDLSITADEPVSSKNEKVVPVRQPSESAAPTATSVISKGKVVIEETLSGPAAAKSTFVSKGTVATNATAPSRAQQSTVLSASAVASRSIASPTNESTGDGWDFEDDLSIAGDDAQPLAKGEDTRPLNSTKTSELTRSTARAVDRQIAPELPERAIIGSVGSKMPTLPQNMARAPASSEPITTSKESAESLPTSSVPPPPAPTTLPKKLVVPPKSPKLPVPSRGQRSQASSLRISVGSPTRGSPKRPGAQKAGGPSTLSTGTTRVPQSVATDRGVGSQGKKASLSSPSTSLGQNLGVLSSTSTPSPALLTKSPLSAESRSSLREQGERARAAHSHNVKQLADDERKRLLAEGRRFLTENKKTGASPSKTVRPAVGAAVNPSQPVVPAVPPKDAKDLSLADRQRLLAEGRRLLNAARKASPSSTSTITRPLPTLIRTVGASAARGSSLSSLNGHSATASETRPSSSATRHLNSPVRIDGPRPPTVGVTQSAMPVPTTGVGTRMLSSAASSPPPSTLNCEDSGKPDATNGTDKGLSVGSNVGITVDSAAMDEGDGWDFDDV